MEHQDLEDVDLRTSRSPYAGAQVTSQRRGVRVLIGVVCLVACVAGGGGAVFAITGSQHQPQQEKNLAMSTAVVERGALTGNTSVTGTLAYAESRSIGAGAGGVITAVPATGTAIGLGQSLFSIDNTPTFLFIGALPAWRAFEGEMDDGPDVQELEQSLASLGYFGGAPDLSFTWRTTQAIMDWQKAVGQPRTGEIPLGHIIFSTGDVRIAEIVGHIGDRAGEGAPVVRVTNLTKIVSADLKLADQALAVVGAKVGIDLPGGKSTTGSAVSVGVPTERESEGKKVVSIPVQIALDDAAATGELQQATVTVNFSTEKRDNVLSVPVDGLLALDSNTFGVEVVRKNGTTQKIAVKTGLFAAGRVEISGSGIIEGQKIVVPKI